MRDSLYKFFSGLAFLLFISSVARSQACPEPSTALRAVAKGRGGTLQDYQRAAKIRSTFNKLAFKTRVEPHWMADSPRFWYRNETRQGKEFILVDAEKGTRGSQSFSTPKAFRAYYNAQSVAELGFLVIMVDGLGMGGPDPVGITITHTKTSAPASAGASLSPRTRGAACRTTPTHRAAAGGKNLFRAESRNLPRPGRLLPYRQTPRPGSGQASRWHTNYPGAPGLLHGDMDPRQVGAQP
jgi:hypothetical protein